MMVIWTRNFFFGKTIRPLGTSRPLEQTVWYQSSDRPLYFARFFWLDPVNTQESRHTLNQYQRNNTSIDFGGITGNLFQQDKK